MKQITSADDIKQLGTILSIWAHPDDESVLAAGILSTAANNGQKVICVTATQGEEGLQNDNRWPLKRLGIIRSNELDAALNILGVKTHYYLGCRDGQCEQAPPEHSIDHLKEIIKKEQPDTILTFGPDGWTGHPDHVAVGQWAQKAAGKCRVYQVVQNPKLYEEYLKAADKDLDIFFNIKQPKLVKRQGCDICFDLPEPALKAKYQALKSMPSQYEKVFKLYGKDFVYKGLSNESYVLAS